MKTSIKTILGLLVGSLLLSMVPVQETVSDIDGNTYKVVKIGNQLWLSSNLRTTKFSDGTAIMQSTSPDQFFSIQNIPTFYQHENTEEYKKKFGMHYNWNAATDSKGLCPKGWRIPSKADMDKLMQSIGGIEKAGIHLKSKETWDEAGNLNTYGFSAVPAGILGYWAISMTETEARFWINENTGVEYDPELPYAADEQAFNVSWSSEEGSYGIGKRSSGNSCRCMKDAR